MITLVGTYHNGCVKFDKEVVTKEPVEVTVTFLEDVEVKSDKVLTLEDFSFAESQEALKNVKGSLSDLVIEERRHD